MCAAVGMGQGEGGWQSLKHLAEEETHAQHCRVPETKIGRNQIAAKELQKEIYEYTHMRKKGGRPHAPTAVAVTVAL